MTAVRFIGSEIYRTSSYGARHPLAIPRVSTCMDLSRALGWLPESAYIDSPMATKDQLARFHDPAYIDAVIAAETRQGLSRDLQIQFNIGRNGNPIFPEIFRRPATSCGGSLLAADLLLSGDADTVYSPAGGTHHGRPGHASGFCYFNDLVLAILRLLDGGIGRVLYLDLDAHHGDGVQDAFANEERVLTISIHENGRWPMRADSPNGSAMDRDSWRNFPVPADFNDSELAFLMAEVVWPLAEAFEPEAVVLQCGADALADDPQSKLALSNGALWRAVADVREFSRRLLVVGGGGYNPWSVGRCWAGVWATLNRFEIPARLPSEAEAVLRDLTWRHSRGRNPPEHWFTSLEDSPNDGQVRPDVRALLVS